MELLVLDTNLDPIAVLDSFESLIWTDKYCDCGDFEIYEKASADIVDLLREDYYLWSKDSDHLMIIENPEIESDTDNGDHIIFTGRSGESILYYRIVWDQTMLSGNLQNGIKKLLDENAIAPTNPDRVIPNLIFEESTDPAVTGLTVDKQVLRGANLFISIQDICIANNLGFKITLADDSNQLVFKLYAGVDRSYDQLANSYVVFSSNFENVISTNYKGSKAKLKTVSLVVGEGEGSARKTVVVGNATGMARREMFTDAKDVSQTVNDVLISDTEYEAQLGQRGLEDLAKNTYEQKFTGDVDTIKMFKLGEHFFMGDIVQLVSDYGIEAKARVTEIIRFQNTSGIDVYPTFTMIA